MLWIRHLLQPQNRAVLNIITHKAHGFERGIPGCFIDVMSSVGEQEVIIKKWDEGDFSHMVAGTQYNDKCNEYVEREYNKLIERRRAILKDMESFVSMDGGDDEAEWGSELQKKFARGMHGDERRGQSNARVAPDNS